VSLGQYESAITSYDRALHLRPDDAIAEKNRAVAIRKLERRTSSVQIPQK
jgi:Flp pilus assembly protein TadD